MTTDNELHEELTTADKVDALVVKVDALETLVRETWTKIEPLLGEVVPLIAKIEASPMFKMITAGGKKK